MWWPPGGHGNLRAHSCHFPTPGKAGRRCVQGLGRAGNAGQGPQAIGRHGIQNHLPWEIAAEVRMRTFLEREKLQQAQFKAKSPYFSEGARRDGPYRGVLRPYCLPLEYAQENLCPEIREKAIAYFVCSEIKWHDGVKCKPSNHLCESQVCCVNFLFPFWNKPQALAQVLRRVFPDIRSMLPVENGQYVACEWIGQENYLNEGGGRSGRRTRGANFTSADAMVMFERSDGKRQIVLIEWKYTESYAAVSLAISKSGTDRTKIYRSLLNDPDCPIRTDLLPDEGALFYEPFYQLMRQQLLAHEMERNHELGADVVSLLHIAPAHNQDFRRVTSPRLMRFGDTPTEVWSMLVRPHDRFVSVSTERLFGGWSVADLPEMREWLEYITARYPWVGSE